MEIGDDHNSNNNIVDDNRYSFLYSKDKNNHDANSRIVITAIISLSFVVLLVTLLHVYARFVIRRQHRRREALRRLGFARALALVHTSEPPKTGLDPSVIASLPVSVFKQTNRGSSIECSVCLCVLEDGERFRLLPNCKHGFHVGCIDKWLGSNSTCPICRVEAEPRLVAEPRDGMVVAKAGVPPSAPPFEGTLDGGGAQPLAKVDSGSSSRLNSFRIINHVDKMRVSHILRGSDDVNKRSRTAFTHPTSHISGVTTANIELMDQDYNTQRNRS